MKNTTERYILTHTDACGRSVFCFYIVEHLVMQVK